MVRLIRLVVAFCLFQLPSYGQTQTTVFQDARGQILTTLYNTNRGGNFAYTQLTLQGSPFLTFPVWQDGTIRLDKQGQEIPCQLAYNQVTSEVLCRFPSDSTAKHILPETFTINGTEFVRHLHKAAGVTYTLYTTVLHDGRTKLLVNLTKYIDANYLLNNGYNNYGKEADSKGAYKTKTDYYIQKGNAPPIFITLTKNAVLAALYEQADKLTSALPAKNLTPEYVAKTLTYYDGLMAADRLTKLPLSVDPVFTQTLHDEISYPAEAWTKGVYSRVYAGFDIDDQGRIKNIVLLSPTNAGFGFAVIVKNALEKLPPVAPALHGHYALPVAFVYTNATEKTGPHVPVNHLTDARLVGRTLLEEVVVPSSVSKPVITSSEVWGYFN